MVGSIGSNYYILILRVLFNFTERSLLLSINSNYNNRPNVIRSYIWVPFPESDEPLLFLVI